MKCISHYDSVLAAIEYKSLVSEMEGYLRGNKVLSEYNLNGPIYSNLEIGTTIFGTANQSKATINANRIQFEAHEVPLEETNYIPIVMEELSKAHKIISSKAEIDFVGAVFIAEYELEEDDLKKIEKHDLNRMDIKKKEYRINFIDENELNYNIFFTIDSANKMIVTFDINTKTTSKKQDWNVEKIIALIRNKTEDNASILTFFK